MRKKCLRGEIYMANFGSTAGSTQGGVRPILILQNNTGNLYSPTVIGAAMTARTDKKNQPTHVMLSSSETGLRHDSIVLMEQIQTLDKRQLIWKVGCLTDMERVNAAIKISFGMEDSTNFQNLPNIMGGK